jgi:hypothetical protein
MDWFLVRAILAGSSALGKNDDRIEQFVTLVNRVRLGGGDSASGGSPRKNDGRLAPPVSAGISPECRVIGCGFGSAVRRHSVCGSMLLAAQSLFNTSNVF